MRSAARVGEHTAVTWKLLYVTPICCTREKAGELIGPPNVSIAPNPASSMMARSTFGAPSGAFGPGIIDQSATESLRVRPAVPPNVRSGMGSALRSCWNLPIAVASSALSARTPSLSVCATDFAGVPGRACSIASRCSSSNTVMTPAVPGGSFSARSSMPAFDLVIGELPDQSADGAADRDRSQQRRREEPDHEARAGAPPETLAAQVVAVLNDRDVAAGVVRDEDRPLDLGLLVRDDPHETVEVLRGHIDVLVHGDENVGHCVCHPLLPPIVAVG